MASSAAFPARSALDALVVSELQTAPFQTMTIHAGHYAVFRSRQSGVCDFLADADDDGPGLGFVDFCHVTWEAACRSVAAFPNTRAQLMVLVNDWQFVSPELDVRRENERAISRVREKYYMTNPTLPAYHLKEMERHGLSADLILRCRQDRWLFSESALRSELNSLIREVLADERRASAAGVRKHFNENGEPVIDVCDNESGDFRLLYCGNTNCAGEIVSLLGNLYARGVRRFLNIYPSLCREPVNAGTGLAYRLFGLDGFKVTNIAVGGATRQRTDLQLVVERFDSSDFPLLGD